MQLRPVKTELKFGQSGWQLPPEAELPSTGSSISGQAQFATLKLAVSGPRAPDVVQANQGRPVMGQLVRAKLLRPLTDYEGVYGWDDRYSKLLRDLADGVEGRIP